MSTLIAAYLDINKLPKEKFQKTEKGDQRYYFMVSVDDKTNQYSQNVSCFDQQTQEERDVKKKREYIGNGRVIWTDGNIILAEKKTEQLKKEEIEPPF